jgi:hypothetical protein
VIFTAKIGENCEQKQFFSLNARTIGFPMVVTRVRIFLYTAFLHDFTVFSDYCC